MIVNTIRITVEPEKRTELFQTIRRLLEHIKLAKGCLTFRFYVDALDENSSLLISEWETELDLKNYLHSEDFAVIRGAITVLRARSNTIQAFDLGTADTMNGKKIGVTRDSVFG